MVVNKKAKRIDIHSYQKKLDKSLQKLKESTTLTETQKRDILDFIDELRDAGLSVPRIHKYVYTLAYYAEWFGKEFGEVDKDDIIKTVREHVDGNAEISDATKYHYKVTLRRFFWWFCSRDIPPDMRKYPEMVHWIKPKSVDNESKLPEEILSEGDMIKLLDTDAHPRNKAIVAVLFNSGARVGEFLNLRLRHVEIDKYGASITVMFSKTTPRKIRMAFASPYLVTWVNIHPFRNDPDAYLWCPFNSGGTRGREKSQPLSYQNLVKILQLMRTDAGIMKGVNPHAFRHAAATFDAVSGMTEVMMRQKYGWSKNSKTPSIYIHLAQRDMDDFELRRAGLSRNSKRPGEEIRPVQCSRCEFLNKATTNYCDRCGLPLNNIAAMGMEKFNKVADVDLNCIMKDPEVKDLIRRKVEEMVKKEMTCRSQSKLA